MEGFTLVLLVSWLFLLGSFVAMFLMDRAVQKAESRKAGSSDRSPAKSSG
jgi:hypothetical protein